MRLFSCCRFVRFCRRAVISPTTAFTISVANANAPATKAARSAVSVQFIAMIRRSHLPRPFAVEGDHAGEGGLAALELPGEAADDQAAVLNGGVADVAAQVLDV